MRTRILPFLLLSALLAAAGCSDPDSGVPVKSSAVYAGPEGSDLAAGTVTAPVKSIQTALDLVADNGTVYLRAGEYTPGNGLNTNSQRSRYSGVFLENRRGITLKGGYDSEFRNQTGISVLNANKTLHHVIALFAVENTVLEKLYITGGCALNMDEFTGGGILIIRGKNNRIASSVTVTSNDSVTGGGIALYQGSGHIIEATVTGNSSGQGGGIHCRDTAELTLHAEVHSNTADFGGGVCLIDNRSLQISGSITGNQADHGGGVYFEHSAADLPAFGPVLISGNDGCGIMGNSSLFSDTNISWGTGNTPANFQKT